jgi:SatD family (SatD)
MKYRILMADVVDSSKQDPDVLLHAFQQIVKLVNNKWKTELPVPLKISLGDEFQGVVSTVEIAAKIIIYIEEHLAQLDTSFKLRYVLHYGTIQTPINNSKSLIMLGEGLSTAREQLQQLKKTESRFLFSTENKESTKHAQLNRAFVWFQDIVDQWNKKDQPWLKLFLQQMDYKEIALTFDVPRSTAWRRRKSLRMDQYNTAKSLIHGITI